MDAKRMENYYESFLTWNDNDEPFKFTVAASSKHHKSDHV